LLLVLGSVATASAQLRRPKPVFDVQLRLDREPVVAGEQLGLAVVVEIDRGWHINSDEPGDEFSLPTILAWSLPDGWGEPETTFPDGEELSFEFSDSPIEVWEGDAVILGVLTVPESATGPSRIGVEVTAQACNDTQCLPPVSVKSSVEVEVAGPGTGFSRTHTDLFPDQRDAASGSTGAADTTAAEAGRLGRMSFPLLILTVFFAGLALNLTPCVYPLIPITVGFFANQAKERSGGTFGLAVAYVLGMAVTYSALGVTAALTGRLFGAALQHPIVIGVIVAVVLLLAASMFGLWELKVPAWAMRVSGGRSGYLGAVIMGLIVGVVAAPCIGPFVLGLLTFVGQRGDPLLGFVLFFALAMGLGLPYLVLGTFTGAVNRLPTSGAWMLGVRKVFGVLLVALAVFFARSLLPGDTGDLIMAVVLTVGGLYLLLIDRTGHEQPAVDRFMRLVSVALVVVGVLQLPMISETADQHLEWLAYDAAVVDAAVESGQPVIIDFYADWCAPCRELDEKTFSDRAVAAKLAGFARFKVDQTKSTPVGDAAAARYEVLGMPTVIVFSDAKERFRITGFEPPEEFLKRLD
jgi:thiol:disulfide interchange protein DsbD